MKKSNSTSCFTLGLISVPLGSEDLDYEPDGFELESDTDSKSAANVEMRVVANSDNTVLSDFNSNKFGNFRKNYIGHVDVGADSFRKCYAVHNNIRDFSDTATFLDSDSDDESEVNINANNFMNLSGPSLAIGESYSEDRQLHNNPEDSDFAEGCCSSHVSYDNSILHGEVENGDRHFYEACPDSRESGITDKSSLHIEDCIEENSRFSESTMEYIKPNITLQTGDHINPIKPFNFSITLTENSRRIVVPKTVKRKKAWNNKFLAEQLKLTLKDEIISFIPKSSEEKPVSQASIHSDRSFKIPLKRPPTRTKPSLFTVTVSEQGERGVSNVPRFQSFSSDITHNENDDIISISASFVLESEDVTKDEPFSPREESASPTEKGASPTEDTKFPHPGDFNEKVNQWFESIEPTQSSPNGAKDSLPAEPLKRSRVPPIYKGLCYWHVFPYPGRQCTRMNCRLAHSVRDLPEHKWQELLQLPEKQLLNAYDYAKQYPAFYEQIFEKFATVFAERGMIRQTVDIVDHIFATNMSRFWKTKCLEVVFNELQKSDLSFHDAVETVLVQIGLGKFPDLGDQLVSLIASDSHLRSNWPILRRLVVAGHKIDGTVATKLMSNLARPPVDGRVCADVCRLLSRFNFADKREIPADIMAAVEAAAAAPSHVPSRSPTGIFRLLTPPPYPVHRFTTEPHPPTVEAESRDIQNKQDIDERLTSSHRCDSTVASNSFTGGGSWSTLSYTNDETSPRSSPGFVYNCHGAQYDPIEDYGPSTKRKRLDSGSSNGPPSSKTPLSTIKPPEHPRFGYPRFDPAYRFNVSLHNLYTRETNSVDVDEDDVIRLNSAVKSGDGRTFLELLEKYKRPSTVQNFITMTLAHLKGAKQQAAKKYEDLLASIENELPSYYANKDIRVILEVVTMNLLFELEKSSVLCLEAQALLERFSDWDSLVTSRVFTNRMRVSLIGRYLFIARLLAPCRPELTYEIVICPTFHLLEPYDRWPVQPTDALDTILKSDLQARNITLRKLLEIGYVKNVQVVMELYRSVVVKKVDVWKFNVGPFFDPMMVVLINQSDSIALRQILPDIGAFSDLMTKDTLRGYMCALQDLSVKNNSVTQSELYGVYERCMQRGIYQPITCEAGVKMNYVVQLKTDMLNCEIDLIISYYFYQLRKNRGLPPGKAPLSFNIILPGSLASSKIDLLKNAARSSEEINSIVRCRLWSLCSIDSKYVSPTQVNVSKHELVKYLQNNAKP
ncbi:uncharacterized protein LOC132701681 isoform X2 [Cylas formicarius]|uniref:uncharacterized protein LOC132701681 isoform X2 n=1 Tax=Cylas formicarius TaxID=197179 RepID=UPI002958CBAE|nr:uncharacterized protein LOC132701681 isoform X2 [Cylas formicarius]